MVSSEYSMINIWLNKLYIKIINFKKYFFIPNKIFYEIKIDLHIFNIEQNKIYAKNKCKYSYSK